MRAAGLNWGCAATGAAARISRQKAATLGIRMSCSPYSEKQSTLQMLDRQSVPVEDPVDRGADFGNRRHAVDPADQASRFVDGQDRRGLAAILRHAGANRLLIIVGAALELVRTANVAGPGHLRQLVAV